MINYIQQAIRTESTTFNVVQPRLLHASLGIISELHEMALSQDDVNTKEEIGDVLWYIAIALDELGVDFAGIMPLVTITEWDLEHKMGEIFSETIAGFADVSKRACFYGLVLDEAKFGALLADTLRMIAAICAENGIEMEQCMEANIAKLKARYPKKFTTEDAVNRDLDEEHAILSGSQG
jgi:NTP pyrophosphatase (non-canonical NTP hydrolase)